MAPLRAAWSDRGSATAEFVLVGTLLTLLFLAVLQLAIDLHVRNVLAACAADGARYAANADIASPDAATQRTTDLVRRSLGGAASLSEITPALEPVDGAQVVVVRVSARLPTVFGLLPAIPVHVEGRAMLEGAPLQAPP
jgi:Flp pilus assembly protein TadG